MKLLTRCRKCLLVAGSENASVQNNANHNSHKRTTAVTARNQRSPGLPVHISAMASRYVPIMVVYQCITSH